MKHTPKLVRCTLYLKTTRVILVLWSVDQTNDIGPAADPPVYFTIEKGPFGLTDHRTSMTQNVDFYNILTLMLNN